MCELILADGYTRLRVIIPAEGHDGLSLRRGGARGVEVSYFSDAFGVRKRVHRKQSKIILRFLV